MKEKITLCIKKMQQKFKGSILAYSLIILAMMFSIVGSLSMVTVLEKKSASSTKSSAQSFQVADSAVQKTIKEIDRLLNNNPDATISNLTSCYDDGSGIAKIKDQFGTYFKYELAFKKDDNTFLTRCSDKLSEVTSIKSIGSYKEDTVRAVEVAYAHTPSSASVFPNPGCYIVGMVQKDGCSKTSVPTEITGGWGFNECKTPGFNLVFNLLPYSPNHTCMWLCCQGV